MKSSITSTHVTLQGMWRSGGCAWLALAVVAACSSSSNGGGAAKDTRPWQCGEYPSQDTCLCAPNAIENGGKTPVGTCDVATYGSPSMCCYRPDTAECSCYAITCTGTADRCSCGPATFAGSDPVVASCTGAICCQSSVADTCYCGSAPCTDGATQIPACDVSVLGCDQEVPHTRVDSCTEDRRSQ